MSTAEKSSFASSFSRGFKSSVSGGGGAGGAGLKEQRAAPHHGYASSASQSVMSKYLYKMKR